MKVFGHPLHTMIIHFPTALLPMDFVLSLLGNYYQQSSFNTAAFYCMIGGVTTGLLALITGLIDLVAIPTENKPASNSALIHGMTNGSIILVYSVIAFKAWKNYPALENPSLPMLWAKGILVALLFIGNYLGGRLIYKHHIGIQKSNHG